MYVYVYVPILQQISVINYFCSFHSAFQSCSISSVLSISFKFALIAFVCGTPGERMVEISQLKDDLVYEMRLNDEETGHLQVKGQTWVNDWPTCKCSVHSSFPDACTYSVFLLSSFI